MKPVLVTVKSIQRDTDGEDIEVELVSTGSYYERNGTQYIRYNESETTGLDGVQTTIKVKPERVILLRHGKMEMRHEYALGKTSESFYDTPLGKLPITVKTHELTTELSEGKGNIHIGFDVSISGEWQFYNQLLITVQEDQ